MRRDEGVCSGRGGGAEVAGKGPHTNLADRYRNEGDGGVVRVNPGEPICGDVLLERLVPGDTELLDRHTTQKECRDKNRHLRNHGKQHHGHGGHAGESDPDAESVSRSPVQRDEAAEHETNSLRCQDQPPAGPAEGGVGDDRAENRDRAGERCIVMSSRISWRDDRASRDCAL